MKKIQIKIKIYQIIFVTINTKNHRTIFDIWLIIFFYDLSPPFVAPLTKIIVLIVLQNTIIRYEHGL